MIKGSLDSMEHAMLSTLASQKYFLEEAFVEL